MYLNDQAVLSQRAPNLLECLNVNASSHQNNLGFALLGSKERIANPCAAFVSLQCTYPHIFLFDLHSTLEKE